MLYSVWQTELCKAIGKKVAVKITYDDDKAARTFEPYAVYRSTNDNLCVSGTQTANPNKFPPPMKPEPRVFDLEKVRNVTLTEVKFVPDPRFDRFDARYKNGIICSV